MIDYESSLLSLSSLLKITYGVKSPEIIHFSKILSFLFVIPVDLYYSNYNFDPKFWKKRSIENEFYSDPNQSL